MDNFFRKLNILCSHVRRRFPETKIYGDFDLCFCDLQLSFLFLTPACSPATKKIHLLVNFYDFPPLHRKSLIFNNFLLIERNTCELCLEKKQIKISNVRLFWPFRARRVTASQQQMVAWEGGSNTFAFVRVWREIYARSCDPAMASFVCPASSSQRARRVCLLFTS